MEVDAKTMSQASRQPETRARPSAMQGAKSLAIGVGLILLLALIGSCGAGYAISRVQDTPATVLGALRDVGVIILALFYLIMVVILAAIYFGLAWVVGEFGHKAVDGVRWIGAKVASASALANRGTEEGVVRPLAGIARYLTTGATFVREVGTGTSAAAAASSRHWRQELSAWPTLRNRLRGRVALPRQGTLRRDGERTAAPAAAPAPSTAAGTVPAAVSPPTTEGVTTGRERAPARQE
jgi:hypothetical protein